MPLLRLLEAERVSERERRGVEREGEREREREERERASELRGFTHKT